MAIWIVNGVEFETSRTAAEYINENCDESLHDEMPEKDLRLDDIEFRLDFMSDGEEVDFYGVAITYVENR